MKIMGSLILLLASCLNSVLAAPQDTVKALENLIEMHQTAAARKHGQRIQFRIVEDKSYNAYGGTRGGFPSIVIFSGFLQDFSTIEVVTVVCHELGHILGEVSFKDATLHQTPAQASNPDAAEGEADYFAGGCLKRFMSFRSGSSQTINQQALNIALSTYEKMYRSKIDLSLAISQAVSGILGSYPTKECRLYSVYQGIQGRPRPACWYNPAHFQ